MTTLCKDISRMDILLHRCGDEKIGVKWEINYQDGAGYVDKNLFDWIATFEMIHNKKVVYQQKCTCTSNGLAICEIPGSTFEGDDWEYLSDGEWRIIGTGPSNEKEIFGHGYYRIV